MPPTAPLPAPAPAQPSPEAAALDTWVHLAVGFVVLTACLEAGEALKWMSGLILPGSILGLFLLLLLLGVGWVRLRWVESAARWLLWLLPLLFMPIFTLALSNHQFWRAQGGAVIGSVTLATVLLWLLVGHVAQWLLDSSSQTAITMEKDQSPGAGIQSPASDTRGRGSMRNGRGTNGWLLALLPLLIIIVTRLLRLGPWVLAAIAGWSFVTVLVYFACRWVFLRVGSALLHPGLTGILVMVVILESVGRPYGQYEASTAWINWLLGPAVVAMAVPIYELRRTVRDNARVLAVAIPLGLAFAAVSTPGLLAAAGESRPVVAAGALKSITSPVGRRLALDAHVPTDATLAGILLAGMLGATVGTSVMRRLGVRDERALGLALGCTSHGIGVAKALELGRAGGAFASLGMSGTAIFGAMILPFVLRWLAGTG